ncbi:uncharacterized protein DMENIID0001_125160 [Sergentomyia squamirostris]
MSATIFRDSPHGTPSHFSQNSQPSSFALPSSQGHSASYFSSPASLQHYHQPRTHHLMNYGTDQRHSKRKSAVELLAESKPLYVKSETVLDRDQQLFRGNASNAMHMLSPTRTLTQQSPVQQSSRHSSNHHQQPRVANRRSASALTINSDLLQTKLRKLLNTSESKDLISDVLRNPSLDPKYASPYGYTMPSQLTQELNIHPNQPKDSSIFFSSAFLSPQSLPPQPMSDDDDVYRFEDTLILTDDYRAISPPAEYAEDHSEERVSAIPRYYQRSFSHSQAVSSGQGDYSPSYNINSHKSLPDLNLQVSRHSPHSEALSYCSRGNRSNKSGSSINRDSGDSSGHYTHQSEPTPCCNQPDNIQCDFRRDSGSSTQHSANSYFAYGIPPFGFDSSLEEDKIEEENDCLLNFTTTVVPEAFQDDYETSKERYFDEGRPRTSQAVRFFEEKAKQVCPDGVFGNMNDLSPPGLGVFKRQKCLRLKQRGRMTEDRRPILRSKSDISDRYWNRGEATMTVDKRYKPEMYHLERFFDRMGLNEQGYEELVKSKSASNSTTGYSDKDSDQSSVVFFSDVSTVDSTRLPDSTETTSATGPYRSTEPPSIVERNARIIKWLCNCKRVQRSNS